MLCGGTRIERLVGTVERAKRNGGTNHYGLLMDNVVANLWVCVVTRIAFDEAEEMVYAASRLRAVSIRATDVI